MNLITVQTVISNQCLTTLQIDQTRDNFFKHLYHSQITINITRTESETLNQSISFPGTVAQQTIHSITCNSNFLIQFSVLFVPCTLYSVHAGNCLCELFMWYQCGIRCCVNLELLCGNMGICSYAHITKQGDY